MKLSEIVRQGYDAGLYGVRTNACTVEAMDYLNSIADDPEQFDVEVSTLMNDDGSVSVYRLNESGQADSVEWVRLTKGDE